MAETPNIKLDTPVTKLVKENYPELVFKAPSIKALSICVEKFLVSIIDESAQICLEKQKNTMTEDHFYQALEKRHFQSLIEDAKTKGKEIGQKIKERNESWKGAFSGEKLSREEAIAQATMDREAVQLALKRKRQADAAKAALDKQ